LPERQIFAARISATASEQLALILLRNEYAFTNLSDIQHAGSLASSSDQMDICILFPGWVFPGGI
jgi:hypothetical protein